MQSMTGLIVKALSGFYYCLPDDAGSAGEPVECRARGAFRNEAVTPLVGDRVRFEIGDDGRGYVLEILPRRNAFTRPPVANLDRLFIVASVTDPSPSLQTIDKLLTVCEYKEIAPILVITKTDLGDPDPLRRIYETAGFPVLSVCNHADGAAGELDGVRAYLQEGVSAFCGNTGVGKSSLLNRLFPGLELATGDISQKLGRGRHTTRHVELYPVPGGNGFVADTPGFGTMELSQYDIIRKEQLQYCFREFEPHLGSCRFPDCSHTTEIGCAVLEALRAGEIMPSRHESYAALYEEARQIKEWELDKERPTGRR